MYTKAMLDNMTGPELVRVVDNDPLATEMERRLARQLDRAYEYIGAAEYNLMRRDMVEGQVEIH